MTVSSLVDVIHGRLVNHPAINRVESIRIDAKKVRRGDCFFAFFEHDIERAVANGAYAVVSTKPKPADDEIAWIAVDEIQDAILLLLRYLLANRAIRFFHADEPLFAIGRACLGKNRSVAMLESTTFGLMETLLESERITHCIGSDKALLHTLSPQVEEMHGEAVGEISHSLFEIRMSGFAPLPLPTRLASFGVGLLTWAKKEKLEISCDISGEEGLFFACYLTRENRFSLRPTARVAIIDYPFNDAYISESLTYIDENFRWGRREVIRQSDWSDFSELGMIMDKKAFDFIYIEAEDPAGVLELLKEPAESIESTLF